MNRRDVVWTVENWRALPDRYGGQIEGNPRPIRDGYDLGADEVLSTYLPLVLRSY